METKTNQYLPQSVSHPGKTLEVKLRELKMTAKDFAVRTNTSEEIINSILTGNSAITSYIAILFEEVLRIPAHFWLIRQNSYDEAVASLKKDND